MKRSRIIQVGLLVLVALVASAVVAALAFGRSTAAPAGSGPPPNPGPPGSPTGQLTLNDGTTAITLNVLSFSAGVSNPVTIGSGSGAGRANLSSLNLMTPVDASFPVLYAASAGGKEFTSAVLTSPVGNATLTYQLDNVFIESAQQSGSGGDATESISLAFEKVHWTFKDASGTTTTGWDVVQSKAS